MNIIAFYHYSPSSEFVCVMIEGEDTEYQPKDITGEHLSKYYTV